MLTPFLLIIVNGIAQSDSKKDKISADAQTSKAEFIKADSRMAGLFSNAYGYIIFPDVGKGAIAVGGAAGNAAAAVGGQKFKFEK